MKNVRLILSAFVTASIMLASCTSRSAKDKESSNETVLPNKSSSSNEVTIGNQKWMAENLNVDKFRNGEPIPEAKTDEEWDKAGDNKQPAWCYYDNNPANGEKYGKLYNWYAVTDSRGLAPKGWHVPSEEEWTELTDYLGGSGMLNSVAADKMKISEGWDAPDKGGSNSSGFSGIPGGKRFVGISGLSSSFSDIRKSGYWWSTSRPPWWFRTNDFYAYRFFLYYESADLTRELKNYGLSVRCIKD